MGCAELLEGYSSENTLFLLQGAGESLQEAEELLEQEDVNYRKSDQIGTYTGSGVEAVVEKPGINVTLKSYTEIEKAVKLVEKSGS